MAASGGVIFSASKNVSLSHSHEQIGFENGRLTRSALSVNSCMTIALDFHQVGTACILKADG